MSKQNIRFIFLASILFLGFLLFNAWENDKVETSRSKIGMGNIDISSENDKFEYSGISKDSFQELSCNDNKSEIIIDTDLIFAKINLHGGDITFLSLKKYPKSLDKIDEGVVVFDVVGDRYYIPQSGFLNKTGPDSKEFGRCLYSSFSKHYEMEDGKSDLVVKLAYENINGVIINKIYTFRSYSYEIDVQYEINNKSTEVYFGKMYTLIKKKNFDVKSGFLSSSSRSYEGAAVYTKDKPYKKLSFEDMASKNFYDINHGGWIAMLEHYFICSWIPSGDGNYIFGTEKLSDDTYVIKCLSENDLLVGPGENRCVSSVLFVGPKIKSILSKLSKGLDLAIDYGIFWPIASPIFLMLSKIYSVINNWGVAIILVTLIIKLLFFHLSSIGYRSMGNMKKLQPRIEVLKSRYKDDKKKFGQAVMELYRKEKVNPLLGGCLPILIQIPVFISLYYVLLESVELRQAPFIFWINDLSEKDAYYVLPVIMSITMFIQQKLNPTVQDPLQAKIIMFMPLIFLFIFLQFASGLILYWIINNILSIIQQWIIMKRIDKF